MNKIIEILKNLNKFTKTLLITGIVLILYGNISRIIDIYFFWESKSIGWNILFIGIIGLLLSLIKQKKIEKKKRIFENIGVGIIVFGFITQTILMIVIPFTDAYSKAKYFIKTDSTIKKTVGKINGFGLMPTGGIQMVSDSSGEYGNATINLTIKADKKFKDITIYLEKYIDNPNWEVVGLE